MKKTNINHSSIICVVIILLTVFGVLNEAKAQPYPIALKPNPITGNKAAIECQNTNSDQTFTIGYLSPGNKEYYQCLASAYRKNPNRADRDRLIFMAITQIDINFKNYRRDRRVRSDLFQIVMDFLRIGATTAASITNGERAKSIISNIATLLLGTGASVNKNFRFLEQQMLFNKMEAERDKVMMTIFDQIAKNDIDVYPFERAFIDIFDYYEAGTMTGALTKLGSDTGAEAKANADELNRIKNGLGPSLFGSATAVDHAKNANLEKIRALRARGTAIASLPGEQRAAGTADLAAIYRNIFASIDRNVILRKISSRLPNTPAVPASGDSPGIRSIQDIYNALIRDEDVTAAEFDLYLTNLVKAVNDETLQQELSRILGLDKNRPPTG